jgi:hypothetical protein
MSMQKPAPRTSANPGPAYWILVPALVLSAFALWASVHRGLQLFNSLLALSALLPALCGIVLRATRRMTGASICAVIVLAWYWPFSLRSALLGCLLPCRESRRKVCVK